MDDDYLGTRPAFAADWIASACCVLDEVPDGWAKWDGRWVRVAQADRSDADAGNLLLVAI